MNARQAIGRHPIARHRFRPSPRNLSAVGPAVSAAKEASRSLPTTAAGVPFGKKNAIQLATSKSFRPCSWAVGTSGRLDTRLADRMASVFTVPASICGLMLATLKQK